MESFEICRPALSIGGHEKKVAKYCHKVSHSDAENFSRKPGER
jgi:hypothetical protein